LGSGLTQQATAGEITSVKDVPEIERRLVDSIERDGTNGRFLIPHIRPIGSGTTIGRICVAGRGSLPFAKDTAERLADGVILEWIGPV
jgi:hypothetical protein